MKYIALGFIILLLLASYFLYNSLRAAKIELKAAREGKQQQEIYYKELAEEMEKKVRYMEGQLQLLHPSNRGK